MLPRVKVRLRTRDFARTTFRPRHRVMAKAFAEAFLTDDAPIDDARLESFVDDLDHFISHASKTLRFGLASMLDVIRLLPPFLIGRFATFDDLPLADRTRMLEAMERSKVTAFVLMFVGYKTVMAMAYFEDPRELASIGYLGPDRHRYKLGLPTAPVERADDGDAHAPHEATP